MLVSARDAMQARCHPRAPRMRSAQKSFKPVTRKGLGGDAGAFLTQVGTFLKKNYFDVYPLYLGTFMSKMGTPRPGSPRGTPGTTRTGATPRTPGTTRSGAQSARYAHSHPTTSKKRLSKMSGYSRLLTIRKQDAYFRGTQRRWSSSAGPQGRLYFGANALACCVLPR